MRTFVAIELNEICRRNLSTAIERMQDALDGIKWTDPENAHLTLKFIGQLDESVVPRATEIITQAASDTSPFPMRLRGLSAFPSESRPRVIFARVNGPGNVLPDLANAIDLQLARELDIERETRDFVGHVTLGRVKDNAGCPPVKELARTAGESDFGEVEVEEIVLMKSDLTPRGAVYTPLDTIPLEEAADS
ncbi:MAG: RNA 2',3'-cyclic phosphodiesterase [Planctomycetota bacterium]